MSVSLEGRCPFLDPEVIGLAAVIPARLKQGKYILKKALEGILPQEIVNRKKKGFGIPLTKWLKTDLADMLEEHTQPGRIQGWGLDPKAVSRLKNDHLAGREDNRLFLWALIVLSVWHDNLYN